jgi:hypothetical protein
MRTNSPGTRKGVLNYTAVPRKRRELLSSDDSGTTSRTGLPCSTRVGESLLFLMTVRRIRSALEDPSPHVSRRAQIGTSRAGAQGFGSLSLRFGSFAIVLPGRLADQLKDQPSQTLNCGGPITDGEGASANQLRYWRPIAAAGGAGSRDREHYEATALAHRPPRGARSELSRFRAGL